MAAARVAAASLSTLKRSSLTLRARPAIPPVRNGLAEAIRPTRREPLSRINARSSSAASARRTARGAVSATARLSGSRPAFKSERTSESAASCPSRSATSAACRFSHPWRRSAIRRRSHGGILTGDRPPPVVVVIVHRLAVRSALGRRGRLGALDLALRGAAPEARDDFDDSLEDVHRDPLPGVALLRARRGVPHPAKQEPPPDQRGVGLASGPRRGPPHATGRVALRPCPARALVATACRW